MGRRVAAAEFALALAIVALGLFFLIEAQAIKVAPVYSRIGPRFFPMLVGFGLCGAGALLAVQAASGRWRAPAPDRTEGEATPSDWRAILLVSAGLLQQALLVRHAGFIPSTALLFLLVALGFGSRRYLRDAAIAVLLSVGVFVGFTAGLKLALPEGPLEAIL
jgi:putative tricarboxylic transport membrane protein